MFTISRGCHIPLTLVMGREAEQFAAVNNLSHLIVLSTHVTDQDGDVADNLQLIPT